MPNFETERTILRPVNVKDAADLKELFDSPDVTAYLRYDAYAGLAEAEQAINDHFSDEKYVFGIEEKKSGKLIGFFEFHPEDKGAILTYALNQSYWGQGLMPEVGEVMVDYGFNQLGFDEFFAHYLRGLNDKSGRVMEKLGMHDDGEIQHVSQYGKEFSLGQYSLTKDEYLKR
ncbi:GNAT family N-acetyltransferase [Pediococcus argentinicus]|uniref:GNAT family N-acetyltransferase n=1 Tax=Pediococcus argentinicus TaxID=480391 RepID=UPI00338DCD31